MVKERSKRNQTLTLDSNEFAVFQKGLNKFSSPVKIKEIENSTICQDLFETMDNLPDSFIDLAFIDPPYNLNKHFNTNSFKEMNLEEYSKWLDSWVSKLIRLLKPTASVYICGDWRSSAAIYNVASKYLKVRNRITWEREKGRGAKTNWKNCCEDIWFCTVTDKYYFNADAVKLKRHVIAPYRDKNGKPKDWVCENNKKYRVTFPSNIWTNITVPFWSMPENTEHPTQKPEKLLAKIILASSKPGEIVFDPFLGSGTTSVVAKKLGRKYVGIEIDNKYCLLAQKRLAQAEHNKTIQGYLNGYFLERNTNPNE